MRWAENSLLAYVPTVSRLTSSERIGTIQALIGNAPMTTPIIAVLALDGISPFHLSVPCLVFGADRTNLGLPRFDFRVCGVEEGLIQTDAGLSILVPHWLAALAAADIVIIPSWKDL